MGKCCDKQSVPFRLLETVHFSLQTIIVKALSFFKTNFNVFSLDGAWQQEEIGSKEKEWLSVDFPLSMYLLGGFGCLGSLEGVQCVLQFPGSLSGQKQHLKRKAFV